MTTGTIKKVVADRGFGFITADDTKDYFFHRNSLDSSLDFDRLNGGADLMRVNFEQIGADVIAAGLITRQQIDADLATLEREDFAIPSPILWSVIGKKPG